MDIYDLFRLLLSGRPVTDHERASALQLIDSLQNVAAFGTFASSTTTGDHACEPKDSWFPGSRECRICGKALEPPLHSCVPKEFPGPVTSGWRGTATAAPILKCAVCGKGM